MLRYQQQFEFFDVNKIAESVRFVNLSADLIEGNFERVLSRIAEEVKGYAPSLVFVDSVSIGCTGQRGREIRGCPNYSASSSNWVYK